MAQAAPAVSDAPFSVAFLRGASVYRAMSETDSPPDDVPAWSGMDEPFGYYATLDASVRVEDATEHERELYDALGVVFEDTFRTLVSKNRDYGSTWLHRAMEEHERGGVFEHPFKEVEYGLYRRAADKQDRYYSQSFAGGVDNVGENLSETSGDAVGYWALITALNELGPSYVENAAAFYFE